jgi:isopenicillin N synthase-like dioxygenase
MQVPGLRPAVSELYARQDTVARVMLRAFAEMFELPPDTFSRHFSWRSSSSLRLLRYPGSASPEAATSGPPLPDSGISPHTDFEMFTLMSQVRL